MAEKWPWQESEVGTVALTVALCAIFAWAGGGFSSSEQSSMRVPVIVDTPLEQTQEQVQSEDTDSSNAQPPAPVDLVGMIVHDKRAANGFALITTYNASFSLDLGDDNDTFDPTDSYEWHVVGQSDGTIDEGTGYEHVISTRVRPFNEVVYERVEVPVQNTENAQQQTPVEPDPAPEQTDIRTVTVAGTIDPYIMAIGGDTTGIGIRTAANEVIELDLSAVLDIYRSTDNREFINWIVTGELEERAYPTRGIVPTLRVLELKAGGN